MLRCSRLLVAAALALAGCSLPWSHHVDEVHVTVESGSTHRFALVDTVEGGRPAAYEFMVYFEIDSVIVYETATRDTIAHHRFEYDQPGLHQLRCGIKACNEDGGCRADTIWSEPTYIFVKYLGKVDSWFWFRIAPQDST